MPASSSTASLAPPPSASLPPITPTLLGDEVDSDAEEEAELARLLAKARQAAKDADLDPLQGQQATVLFESDSEEDDAGPSSSRLLPGAQRQSTRAYLERPLRKGDVEAPPPSRKGKEVDRISHLLDAKANKWDTMPVQRLSKKQYKASRPHTAGSAWFDMPAPEVTPAVKREIQAMRLTGALDPKHFQRGEAKRDRNKVPEFFQLGHVIDSRHPASTAASAPAVRKRTFVETLVDDTESRAYAAKKYKEAQAAASSGGKAAYRARQAARKQRG